MAQKVRSQDLRANVIFPALTTANVTGGTTANASSTYTYTAGLTAERLVILWNLTCSTNAVVGTSIRLRNNGSDVGTTLSADGPANATVSHAGFATIDVAAGSSNILGITVTQTTGGNLTTTGAQIMIIVLSQ